MIGDRFKNIYTRISEKGFSLLELVVAVAIFGIIILLANTIYINAIKNQKRMIASQTTQENIRFVFEMMSKEIRSAKGDFDGSDCVSDNVGYYKIFNGSADNGSTTPTDLVFKNKKDECVKYYLSGNALQVKRGAMDLAITPDELKINTLKFRIDDVRGGVVGQHQPSVTVFVEAEMVNDSTQKIKMQTTISSRNYR